MRPYHSVPPFQPDRRTRLGILSVLTSALFLGCSESSNAIVEETDAYSYDDVLAQIDAEEAAEDESAEE